jgi:hypothetical protein
VLGSTQLWGNTGMVRVFSDQTALIFCTELAILHTEGRVTAAPFNTGPSR